MKLVKHLLDSKGRHVISATPDTTVLDAIKLMAENAVGSLVVMKDEELCGIITERDYARKVIIKGRASESTFVSEIMSTDVCTTSSSQTVNSCMELMTEKRIRHLPVVEDNRVIGMISIGDLVQAIITDQQEEIEQLEQYISGQ
ncbi:MAG: CBS domain-containing protein [Gammaproteobacteria bacterium]|nr:CBS domain-containing protein [Gammaproteobacteria bacterium]MDH3434847.1 CBS domain-containing protein [Gammaproteobacteria bacterium]